MVFAEGSVDFLGTEAGCGTEITVLLPVLVFAYREQEVQPQWVWQAGCVRSTARLPLNTHTNATSEVCKLRQTVPHPRALPPLSYSGADIAFPEALRELQYSPGVTGVPWQMVSSSFVQMLSLFHNYFYRLLLLFQFQEHDPL